MSIRRNLVAYLALFTVLGGASYAAVGAAAASAGGRAGASVRSVGLLTGGIYVVGPFCSGQQCPSGRGETVVVRRGHARGPIVARETLERNDQQFRFRLTPGRYYIMPGGCSSGAGYRGQHARVRSGRTTLKNLYCYER